MCFVAIINKPLNSRVAGDVRRHDIGIDTKNVVLHVPTTWEARGETEV